MEKEPKTDTQEVRYDASGHKITAPARSKEIESAILAINDKLDQLLGILSSTLPTRIGAELKGVSAGGEKLEKLIEVVSKELPARIQEDASQNTFEKAEMLSMVISTSFQHLSDAFRSYQESIIKALDGMSRSHERTGDVLQKINALLEGLHSAIMERNSEATPAFEKPKEFPSSTSPEVSEPKPFSPPSPSPKSEEKAQPPSPFKFGTEEKSDLPGWLEAKRDDNNPTLSPGQTQP